MTCSKGLHLFFLCIMGLSILLLSGCRDLQLESAWRDREITVDGEAGDWQKITRYVEKTNVAIGLLNDEHTLYVCLTTMDRITATQIARSGFTVWLDPKGGKKKTFGIRFPLGMQASGNPTKLRESMRDPKKFRELFENLGSEMEILGPGEDQRVRTLLSAIEGIEVSTGYSDGKLVYELKVPLARSAEQCYGIGTDPGKQIGLGFETPELDREAMRQAMGQRSGGMGGRGGGRGGMRSGGQMPEPFELWAKVALAAESSSGEN